MSTIHPPKRPLYDAVKLRVKDLDDQLATLPAEEIIYRVRRSTRIVVSISTMRRWIAAEKARRAA